MAKKVETETLGVDTSKQESPNEGGDVRRQAMLLGGLVLALTTTGSTAYAAMGPLYHGNDYALVTDIDGYNSYLGVCDKEADNHLVTANYREYPHPPGDNGSISDSNGSKSPCGGRNSPTYYVDFNVCEATQGCSRWW
jgi:hypothetical protein